MGQNRNKSLVCKPDTLQSAGKDLLRRQKWDQRDGFVLYLSYSYDIIKWRFPASLYKRKTFEILKKYMTSGVKTEN